MTASDNAAITVRRSGSQKRQRARNISVPVDAAELVIIDDKARTAGLSRGAFARAAMLGSAGPRAQRAPTVNAEVLAHAMAALNRVGNNINQIAKTMHAGGSSVTANECFAALAEVRVVVARILEIVGRTNRL